MRKPLGRLAIAVLASVAIPLSFVPAASAADQYNAPSVSVSAFVDNTATGVDLGGGFGMLRINSTAGIPLEITSAAFVIVGHAYQAEEDARSYEVKVQFKGNKTFKKDKPSVTWHCGGGGHQPPTSYPTKPTKPTSDTPTTSETTPSTSDTTPSYPTSSTPTSDTSTDETTPSAPDSGTATTTPSAPDSTTSSPVDTTSSTPTSVATTTTSAPGGGTVTCPVKPVGTTPTGPQQVVRPAAAPETGFGGMA